MQNMHKPFNRRTDMLVCKEYVHKCTCWCILPLSFSLSFINQFIQINMHKYRFHNLEKWRRPFYEVLANYENASVVLPAFYNARNTDVSFRVKYALDDFGGTVARSVFFFHPQYLLSAQRFWAARGIRAKRLSSGLMLATAALELCQEVHLYGFWAFPMNPAGIFVTHHYYDNVKPRPGFHAMPHENFNFLHMHARGILHVHTGVCRWWHSPPKLPFGQSFFQTRSFHLRASGVKLKMIWECLHVKDNIHEMC